MLNRIEIDAEPLGRLAVDGPGAGGASTSSAVLADLMAIARGDGSSWAGLPSVTERREAIGRPVGHAELRAASSGWFAYLPGVSGRRKLGSESVGLYAVEAPGGVAVRTAEPSLVRVRSFVRRSSGRRPTCTSTRGGVT